MWKLRFVLGFLLICSVAGFAAAQRSASQWQTLRGNAPLVIARGGFSGIFPDSSYNAYAFVNVTSLQNTVVWCEVQLTKDGAGICFPDLKLNNASNIDVLYVNRQSTYPVNGVSTQGWFSIDYTLMELQNVTLSQGVRSRTNRYDGTQTILTVEEVAQTFGLPGLWLNVEHDIFFAQHNLSMRSFIISVSRSVVVNYISSPEVNFLRSIIARFRRSAIKLVFRFLGEDDVEPSTNQTYGSLLRNLTFIQTFATAILVPKHYIWPMNSNQYLLPSSNPIVMDAHKVGLEVYASDFSSDATIGMPFAYNYSYDPVAEYLSFIDNGIFSVDGVVTDFPITASNAVDCFSHMGRNDSVQAEIQIISSEGASGTYPGCTDMAYNQAISDGADFIDCPVRMTGDGIPFCLGSANLIDRTTAAQSPFTNVTMTIPQLNIEDGIFSFNLTWSQIQSLQPSMFNPYSGNYSLFRNPEARTEGRLVQLSEFLAIALNATSVSGVFINIDDAAFLAENPGLDVVDAVLDALNTSGYMNQTLKKLKLVSRDSSVLTKFGKKNSYELVYRVGELVGDITNSSILEIRNIANSVIVNKRSVLPTDEAFLTGQTDIVSKLKAFGLSVYVQLFSNEFVSQAWDFFSDAYVEINSHVSGTGINGVITDYPATASKFRRNRCLGFRQLPPYMAPVLPGSLFQLIPPGALPPAQPPTPILTESDVIEPPLPAVVVRPPAQETNGTTPSSPTTRNGQSRVTASTLSSTLAVLLGTFAILKL